MASLSRFHLVSLSEVLKYPPSRLWWWKWSEQLSPIDHSQDIFIFGKKISVCSSVTFTLSFCSQMIRKMSSIVMRMTSSGWTDLASASTQVRERWSNGLFVVGRRKTLLILLHGVDKSGMGWCWRKIWSSSRRSLREEKRSDCLSHLDCPFAREHLPNGRKDFRSDRSGRGPHSPSHSFADEMIGCLTIVLLVSANLPEKKTRSLLDDGFVPCTFSCPNRSRLQGIWLDLCSEGSLQWREEVDWSNVSMDLSSLTELKHGDERNLWAMIGIVYFSSFLPHFMDRKLQWFHGDLWSSVWSFPFAYWRWRWRWGTVSAATRMIWNVPLLLLDKTKNIRVWTMCLCPNSSTSCSLK